jgi:hypothetical protein
MNKETYTTLLPSLRIAASNLQGSKRRMFLGQLALSIGYGGRSLVSKTLKINRQTLNKGIQEIETGQEIEDRFSERGRKPLEEKSPELLTQMRDILDGASQTDPTFNSTRLYTRLSAREVKEQLISRGHRESDLPSNQTIWNKMHSLGYKRKKVAKTKPKKDTTNGCYF